MSELEDISLPETPLYINENPQAQTKLQLLKHVAVEAGKAAYAENLGEKSGVKGAKTALKFYESVLDIEIFCKEFDTTGAYNGDVFHGDLSEIRDSYTFRLDPKTGHIIKERAPKEEYVWLAVGLDNLAIVNTEGSHSSGDNILAESAEKIQKLLIGNGLDPDSYKLYRTGGADFFVRIPKQNQKDHYNLEADITGIDLSEGKYIKLGLNSRLVARLTTIDEAIEIFDQAQDQLPENLRKNFTDSQQIAKYLTSIMLNTVAIQKEYASVASLANKVVTMTSEGFEGEGEPLLVEYAQEYFARYLKKIFTGTELESWDNFRNDIFKNPQETVQKTKALSLQHSYKKAFEGWLAQDEVDLKVRNIAFRRAAQQLFDTDRETDQPSKQALSEAVTTILDARDERVTGETLNLKEFKAEHKLELKKGLETLQIQLGILKQQIDAIKQDKTLSAEDLEVLRATTHEIINAGDEIFYEPIPNALRLGKAKTLNIRGKTEELLSALKPESEVSQGTVDLLEQIYRDYSKKTESERENYDELTGLLKKQEFYSRAKRMVELTVRTEESCVVAFGDINDLNLASSLGNREFGDAQLILTAEAMQKGLASVNCAEKDSNCTSRYAGDEIVAILKGNLITGKEYVKVVQQYIGLDENKIPRHKRTHPDFEPFNPQIGWGFIDSGIAAEDFNALIQDKRIYSDEDREKLLRGQNLENDDDIKFYADELTRFMVKVADDMIEYDKAFKKANVLYEMLYNPRDGLIATDTPEEAQEWRWFNIRLTASAKALKGFDLQKFKELQEQVAKNGGTRLEKPVFDKMLGISEEVSADPRTEAVGKVVLKYVREQEVLRQREHIERRKGRVAS